MDMEYGRSWLSPEGEFIPTNDETGKLISHPSKAVDIVPSEEWKEDEVPADYLYKRGWQRIVTGKLGQFYVGYVVFSTNPFKAPNQIQKNKLIQYAKEYNANQVIYDNESLRGQNGHVIWSKDDVL